MVEKLPANAGDTVQSLGEGDGNGSSVLAWEIPQTEEPGGLRPTGLQRAGHNSVTKTAATTCFAASRAPLAREAPAVQEARPDDPSEKGLAIHSAFLPGESKDRGAWRAAASGGAESDTTD